MDEHVRWVTKAEAAEELEVSLSTLDRKIRNGEVEVRREGRRVFVRMAGEYITDEELLRRAVAREHELERTVRELEQSVSELNLRAFRVGAGARRGQGVRSHRKRPVRGASDGAPEGGLRSRDDEQRAPRDPRARPGAARGC